VKDYQNQSSQDQSKKDYIQKRIKIDVFDQNPHHKNQNTDNQETQVMVVKDFASSMDSENLNSPDKLGPQLEGPIMIQENNLDFALFKNKPRKSGNTMNLADDKANTAESMNSDIADKIKANGLKNREFDAKKNKNLSKKKRSSKNNSKKQSVNQQHQEFNIKIQDGEFQKNLAIGPNPQIDFGSALKENPNLNGRERGRAKRGPRSTDLGNNKSTKRQVLKKIAGNCSSKENEPSQESDGDPTGVMTFSCT
jgi:hypothetical protein